MNTKPDQAEYMQIAKEIEIRCEQYQACGMETERRGEGVGIRRGVEQLYREMKGRIGIDVPELLVALLDAYEVIRDEGMLQEVLDVVSGGMERLEVSAESVKLLSYCYYYVEEEECAVLARRMLEELKQVGDRDVKMAERVYRELVEGEV